MSAREKPVSPAPRDRSGDVGRPRSGATPPEDERSTRQLKLRVDESVIAQLDALVTAANASSAHLPRALKGRWDRSSFVSALVGSEATRRTRRKAR